jgi:Domain of unknown function (DUF4249)
MIAGCKEVYNPPVKNAGYNYLVVEGNIVAGNDSTFIYLTRTIPLDDTSQIQPETNATVQVESNNGEVYQLQNGNNGFYFAAPLHINQGENYRLHIFTANGKEYASDYVPVKQTPPIDSVSWNFDETGGIEVHVSTHDVTNNSRYYRWQYVTTYEHRSVDSSWLIYENGALRSRLHEEQIYRCYNVNTSGEVFIASTAGLASDVVFKKKLASYPYESPLFRYVYSMNVIQYAITKEAYEYWDNLKKNTEQIGSIFDAQPFAEYGNMHCISDTSEPVLGFISACSTSQQRLYIYYEQVHYPYTLPDCQERVVSPSDIDEVFSQYLYLPLYYGDRGVVFAYTAECLDCRQQGGTNIKPPYMP